MKHFFLLSLMLLPLSAIADSVGIGELKTLVQQQPNIDADIQQIEDVVKQEDYDLYEYLQDKTPDEKLPFYKSWLAQKSYESLLDFYMQEMKKVSIKTGRQIKTTTSDLKMGATKVIYELVDDRKKTEYIKQYDIDVTYYPDDYEEFVIQVTEKPYGSSKYFNVAKDDKTANESVFINVSLNNRADFEYLDDSNMKYKSNYMLGVTAQTTDYDKLVEYRRLTAEDMKNGMFIPFKEPCYDNPSKMCKKWKCGGDCSDWSSSSRYYVGEIYNNVIQYSFERTMSETE